MALFGVILKTFKDRDCPAPVAAWAPAWLSLDVNWVSFHQVLAQTLHFFLSVSQEKDVFLIFHDQINRAVLIKRFQTPRISVRLKTAAGRENWKIRVLLIMGCVYVCVHGIARREVIFVPGCIKLKTSLNICVEFWVNWERARRANPTPALKHFRMASTVTCLYIPQLWEYSRRLWVFHLLNVAGKWSLYMWFGFGD